MLETARLALGMMPEAAYFVLADRHGPQTESRHIASGLAVAALINLVSTIVRDSNLWLLIEDLADTCLGLVAWAHASTVQTAPQ